MQPVNAITVDEYKRMKKEPLAVAAMRGMLLQTPRVHNGHGGRAGVAYDIVREEYVFHPTRKWRFDFAAPHHMVAIEIEGVVWSADHGTGKSRHTEPRGYTEDCLKYSEAAALGWLVIRATPELVNSGDALRLFLAAIEVRRYAPEVL